MDCLFGSIQKEIFNQKIIKRMEGYGLPFSFDLKKKYYISMCSGLSL